MEYYYSKSILIFKLKNMKKIILIFLILLTLVEWVNANWDRVKNRLYWIEITSWINAIFEVKKESNCGNEKNNYSKDISSIMQPVKSNWIECNRTSKWTLYCQVNIYEWPTGPVIKEIKMCGMGSEVLRFMGVSPIVYNKYNSTKICQTYKIKMNIIIDSGGWVKKERATKAGITDILDIWKYKYKDNRDCPECYQTSEYKEVEIEKDWKKEKVWKRVYTPETIPDWCWYHNNPDPNPIPDPTPQCVDSDSIKCIKDGKISPVIWNIEIENCEFKNWIYNCYTTEGLNFTLQLSNMWQNPSWIDRVKIFVLNEAWDSNLSDLTLITWLDATKSKVKFYYLGSWFFKKEAMYTLEFQWEKGDLPDNYTKEHTLKVKFVPNPKWLITKLKDWINPWDKFANYIDRYNYNFTITDKFWNPIHDKKIEDLKCNWDNCLKDKYNNLAVIAKNFTWALDTNWKWKFHIISAVPWTIDEKFLWKMNEWDVFYKDINPITKLDIKLEKDWTKNFKKPIIFDNVSVEWRAIDISKKQKYTIKLRNPGNLSGYSNWQIDADISLTDNNFTFSWWLQEENYYFWTNIDNYLWFSAIIKALKDDSLLSNLWIQISNMFIDYTLNKNWEIFYVKYDLSSSSLASCPNRSTLWLVINWTLQWIWKQSKSWLKNNFTDLSKSEVRWEIRKNAYLLTRWLEKWMYLNWILYIEWDKKYSEIKNTLNKNDTIIIKNWNFTINENITKNIWIIVLKDNYNVKSDYKNTWNVYVKKNVSNINAYIYADWWLISWYKLSWNFNTYSDEELKNTLDLKWTLFTKNTIGWSEAWETGCKLPWWEKTDDCYLAEKYDLHYIRKMIICDKDDYSFKITYNPEIQTNPPKGFTK